MRFLVSKVEGCEVLPPRDGSFTLKVRVDRTIESRFMHLSVLRTKKKTKDMDVSESVALNVATCTIFVSELCCMSAETIKQVHDNIRKVEKK